MTKQLRELLDRSETKIKSFREATADLLVVFQKKIERGWMSDRDLEPCKPHLGKSMAELPEIIVDHREFLSDWKKDCETLLSRIENLDTEIDRFRRSK